MSVEELKRILGDQRETLESLENCRLIERDLPFDVYLYISRPNVLAILGARRSSKST